MTRAQRRAGLAVAVLALAALAVLGALASSPAAAQRATPLELRVDVTPRTVTLGDRVRITVIATHTEPLLITADPPSRGDVLQLIEALPAETVTLPDGSLQTEIAFTAAFSGLIEPAFLGRHVKERRRIDNQTLLVKPSHALFLFFGQIKHLQNPLR